MTARSETPGRKRIRGKWVWVAREAARKAGFTPRTVPLPEDETTHAGHCQRLWSEMITFMAGTQRPAAVYDGTLASLSRLYQLVDLSPFHTVEPQTQAGYARVLANITGAVGERRVDALTGLDFRRWHANWAAPKVRDRKLPNGTVEQVVSGPRIRSAQEHVKMLRIILNFGAEQRLAGCATAADILSRIEFAAPKARTESMTRAQAEVIIETALAGGDLKGRSMALAQAIQFEAALRQSDVIGTWRPRNRMMAVRPGVIVAKGNYWSDGLMWSDLRDGLLHAAPFKSGKKIVLEFRIDLYPLIVRVLDTIPEAERFGPMIVDNNKLPFNRDHYSKTWRALANAAGVSPKIWNRDSRAGAITETTDAAPIEDARHVAGHSNSATTARYSRGSAKKILRAQTLRIEHLKQGQNEHGNADGNNTVTAASGKAG